MNESFSMHLKNQFPFCFSMIQTKGSESQTIT